MRLVSIGGRPWAYAYDAENRLVQATLRGATALTLNYDPAGRLRRSDGEGVTEFLYDGNRLVGEYVDGTLGRRYVPGPAPDETVLAYEGVDKFWYYGDHLGSVIATAGASGTIAAINAYGPFGEPGVPAANRNVGRLRYTGQIHLPEVGLYHYKARAYSPRWGRFLQTDPIGAADDANLHAYVGNDPINFADPDGLLAEQAGSAAWDLTKRSTAPYVDFYKGAISGPINWGLGEVSYSPLGDPGLWQSIQGAGPLGAAVGGTGRAVARGLRAYSTVGRSSTPIVGAAKGAKPPIWTSTGSRTGVQNAFGHWQKHGAEFPEFANSKQYVEGAQRFVSSPPAGTLTKTRPNGDMLFYNPTTNTFAVRSGNGAPRTMFRPDPAKHGYPTNLDYFNAQ